MYRTAVQDCAVLHRQPAQPATTVLAPVVRLFGQRLPFPDDRMHKSQYSVRNIGLRWQRVSSKGSACAAARCQATLFGKLCREMVLGLSARHCLFLRVDHLPLPTDAVFTSCSARTRHHLPALSSTLIGRSSLPAVKDLWGTDALLLVSNPMRMETSRRSDHLNCSSWEQSVASAAGLQRLLPG